ncbi:sugar nucleotide-binding protein [Indioceanicola profundi]|uniref:sugar nucleotide-binding protein n=1 Tax=Indioceanicola profundi TaxID=2220096 RepID=UPI000E6AD780|nr:sugar nucleotide-binding protein [Indioceanicola profundi]
MTAAENAVLVVGGDGYVARTLVPHLRSRGLRVAASTRRADMAGPDRPLLDLASGEGFGIAEAGYAAAVLCAARARLADCRADPVGTAQTNVAGTLELAGRLARAGTRILLLSTDKVYDGSIPHRRWSDRPCPASEYGRQKAAAEAGVLALPGASVLRLSKVVGPEAGPFAGWVRSLRAGSAIQPFSDFPLAAVPVGLVAEAAARILDRSGTGIFQLTASEDINYARAAFHLARRIGADDRLVQPVTGRMGEVLGGEPASAFTSLDCSRLRDMMGLAAPDPYTALDSILAAAASYPS